MIFFYFWMKWSSILRNFFISKQLNCEKIFNKIGFVYNISRTFINRAMRCSESSYETVRCRPTSIVFLKIKVVSNGGTTIFHSPRFALETGLKEEISTDSWLHSSWHVGCETPSLTRLIYSKFATTTKSFQCCFNKNKKLKNHWENSNLESGDEFKFHLTFQINWKCGLIL